jgi:hypothetical protein
MRLLALIAAMFVAGGPAAAQSWKEYAYPAYAFTVSFPAEPRLETMTYQAADGRSVEAQVYSVTQDGAAFKMTIVDLSDAAMEESAVIDQAVKTLSRDGEVNLDIPARVNRVYGRQLSIVGVDGSRSAVAMFYHKGRLYQIDGKMLPGGDEAAPIRFQQSLVFTGGESNRPDAVREQRRACRGGPENADAPGAATSDDGQLREARCRRRAR